MKKTLLKIGAIIACTLVFPYSCQDDENFAIEPDNESFSIEDARSWFETNKSPIMSIKSRGDQISFKNDKKVKSHKGLLQADWTHAFTSKKGHLEVVETHLKSQSMMGFSTESSNKKFEETGNRDYYTSLSRLVVINNKKDNTIKSYIMTIIGETNYLEKKNFQLWSNTYLKKDHDFTGKVLFHRESGGFVNGWEFENNKVVGKLAPSISMYSMEEEECTLQGLYITYSECDYAYAHTLGEWYVKAGTCTYWDTLVGTFNSCSASDNTGGAGTPPNLNNNLTGKAGCIFAKLESLGLFEETIENFVDNPEFDLNISMGPCPAGAGGCTNGLQSSNGTISINIQSLGSTSLEGAAIILHEGVHAEIYRYVAAMEPDVDPNDRPLLMYYYNYYGGFWEHDENGDITGVTPAQHYYMAENYVTPIARAIRELDNNSYPLEHYMGYGWDGLRRFGYNLDLLTSAESSDYYQKQGIVNNNSTFGDDCD